MLCSNKDLRAAIPAEWNTSHLLADQAERHPERELFSVRQGDEWTGVRADEFVRQVTELAKGLIAQGIEPGDRVAIMASTRYEWPLADFAIWYAGAVSVPVYESSSPSQVAWILSDSGAKGIIVEHDRHENAVRHAATSEDLAELKHIWQIDGGGLDELRRAGSEVSDDAVETARTRAVGSDVATIIYTSGTTGKPKGCKLIHDNFTLLSESAARALPQVACAGNRTIMFLPLAHVFARYISVLCVHAGATVAHTPDIKNLLPDLQSFKPNFILAVPRVFEKVFNGAQAKAEDGGRGKIFELASSTAIAYSTAKMAGRIPLGLRLRHRIFDALVYRKLREAMGGKIEYAVSGGGPLGERLGHFFSGIGVLILEGYGLTETTAPITVNTVERIKIGTVGRPLPGNEVKIAADGEILAQGVCVFEGYWNREDLDEQTFTDGWFHTGDIGSLDEDGFLTITGRKKEILVTAGGKNVVPGLMEDVIRSKSLVSQAVVVGDNKPFIAALITLDEEALPGWCERHGLEHLSMAEAVQNEKVRAEVQTYVDEANATVSRAESIREFRLVEQDFTEESGHLTPSLKIKRAKVMQDFADVVDSIYAGTPKK